MQSGDTQNYYDILEVTPEATLQDIRNAYIRAKNAYSPDSAALYSLMSEQECARITENIEEAFSILGVPEKRRKYDNARGLNQHNNPESFLQEEPKPQVSQEREKQDLVFEETPASIQEAPVSSHTSSNDQFTYQSQHASPAQEVIISRSHAMKKFQLNYMADPQFDQEIENATHFDGAFLRRIREYKNVTIERLADMTKISKTYLKNIEADEFEKLPARVYTRGFVYQYAKSLKLSPNIVATSYMNHLDNVKSSK